MPVNPVANVEAALSTIIHAAPFHYKAADSDFMLVAYCTPYRLLWPLPLPALCFTT